jgi:3-deoxy-manno-octulosonate cytidylyltransferase (CMP-KDO synthetase)
MKLAVIPARYASTRLPGKPLQDLRGLPLIIRVYNAVVETELFDKIVIATDDERIIKVAEKYGAVAEMTSVKHNSGTDRVAEIAKKYPAEIIVNIQGDEPFISYQPLADLLKSFADKKVQVASLMHKGINKENDPNSVKVVCDKDNFSLYFSRCGIPYNRSEKEIDSFYHIGVYAFRTEVLQNFVLLPQSRLEKIEKLEQLRFLENGILLKMVETSYNGFGIDTPEDLEKARRLIAK